MRGLGGKKMAVRALSLVPDTVLDQAHKMVRRSLGMGWGAFSIHHEVDACIRLLPPESRNAIIAVDVGANRGDWTACLLAAKPRSRILAVEPSGTCCADLRARFGNARAVTIAQVALSDREGPGILWSDEPGSGLASLSQRSLGHLDIDFGFHEDVTLATLDSITSELQIRPNLIKLDVEGHEFAVLEGSTESLTRAQVVQFEFGGCNIDTRTFFRDFYDFFADLNFSLYRLEPHRLRRIDRYLERDEVFETTNYFAVREPTGAAESAT